MNEAVKKVIDGTFFEMDKKLVQEDQLVQQLAQVRVEKMPKSPNATHTTLFKTTQQN